MDYEKILDNFVNIQIIIVDSNNRIVYPSDKKKQDFIKSIYNSFSLKDDCYFFENRYYKVNNQYFYQDNERYNLIYFQDITDFKNMQRKYEIDSLTTVLTRCCVLERIDKFLVNNKNRFSIVMADVDDFKKINDTYGHVVGDVVLHRIGTLLNSNLDNCLIGRYGGEEFIILQKDVDINKSVLDCEKVRKLVPDISIEVDGKFIKDITMSFGVYNTNSIYNLEMSLIDFRNELIKNADMALYKSKHNGKNQVTVY